MKFLKSALGIVVLMFVAAVVYVAGHSGLFDSVDAPPAWEFPADCHRWRPLKRRQSSSHHSEESYRED